MKKYWLILVGIFVLALYLRFMYLPHNILTFGYDQARDAINSRSIIGGDIKILGPSSSAPGLYHGVFYYYFLAPAYWLGNGSPITAAYWVAFVNSLVVFIVFVLASKMTGSKIAGLLSAFLFAISFEATQYATWLSNPTIGIWTVPLMYLGLWLWTMENYKRVGPVVAAIGLGLSIQANIFLFYQAVPLLIWLWFKRKLIERKQIYVFALCLLSSVFTMLLVEIKFGFRGIGGVLSLLTTQDTIVASKGLGDFFVLFFNQIGRVFAYNSYPGNVGYGGMLVLFLIVYSLVSTKVNRDKWPLFLALWLFSHLSVVALGGTSTPFLLVGIGPAVSILLGIYLNRWIRNRQILFAGIICVLLVFGNLSKIMTENSRGSTIFAIQKDMLLAKQLELVDYTYREADGKDFSLNSVTSPLWINIVWSYLYKWYGLPRYGYLPTWHGRDQIGQIDALPNDNKLISKNFLILEPMGGIPLQYLTETLDYENSYSRLIKDKNWGELIVQERIKQ